MDGKRRMIKMHKTFLKTKPLLSAILLLALAGSAFGKDFKIFDGTYRYADGPNLNNSNIQKLEIVYELNLLGASPTAAHNSSWATKDLSAEDETRIRNLAKTWKLKNIDLVCLDIECWPTSGSEELVAHTIKRYEKVLGWIHQEAPNVKIGSFGFPHRPFKLTELNDPQSSAYKNWQIENDRLRPLIQQLDVIFLCLYTNTTDPEKWKLFAKADIENAASYGKPIYPFIWPRYYDSMPGLGWTFIPDSFWKMELNYVKENADGAVIWDYGKWQHWNDQVSWWQAVLQLSQDR